MSSYYSSWKCADLNNATLYSSDVIENPDWTSYHKMCPLAKCFGYDILNHFDRYIEESFQTGVVWTSSIIMLANYYFNSTVQDRGFCIRFATYFEGGIGYLRVTVGSGSHNGFIHYVTRQYTEADYHDFSPHRRKIYIVRKLLRSTMADAGAPNYTGYFRYTFWFGGVVLYTGSWTYDHMVYTIVHGWGDPEACLLSIPCSMSTREDQSEGVYEVDSNYCPSESAYAEYQDFRLTDSSGNYDPDPPDPTVVDPNSLDPDYPSGPAGGDGEHDRSSDPIAIPGLPGVEGIDCGLMTLYYGNSTMIRAFLSNIWVTSIADAIKQFFQQPMDFIIGAMILPLASQLTAAKVGDAHPVFNNIPFEGYLPYVETQYYEIDLGVIEVEKYWGSCFDYDPYTKIQIFLPYIGYRELLADEVMGHNIYCKYHIDACTGDCVAFVGVSAVGPEGPEVERILGQFNGNCGVKIPINSQSYDGAVAAGISMACTFAGIGLSMGLEASGLGDAQSVDATKVLSATSASVISNMKPNVARSGMFGQSAGYMGGRTPFIIKRIPRQSLPENYIYLRGYPSNIYGTLGELSGFAAVEDIQLNNIPAMEDERKEILDWLKGGVLI